MISMVMKKVVKITQIRSSIGRLPKHKAALLGLGLRGIGCSVNRVDTNALRGMIRMLSYMIKVENIDNVET